MSGLIVGLVLRTPITETFNTEAKFIATVYADHAWEDGTHAHPAVETVSNITGLHVRTVQRYIHKVLEPMGMMIQDGKGPRGTNQYRFPLETGDNGSVRLNLHRGGTQSPRQPAGGDRESGDRESGDRIVSPKQTNRPLIHEEEDKGQPKFKFSSELQSELTDLGVFVSTWVHVEKALAGGWTETDVLALLDWMGKTRKDKPRAAQGFVTRIREGTKAPREYYGFEGRKLSGRWYPGDAEQVRHSAPEDDEPEPEYLYLQADETITGQVERAWQSLLGQLSMDMPKAPYQSYVQDTKPVHFEDGVLRVAARSAYARDWLESRLQSACERLLVGIMNQSVDVEFVVADNVSAETEAS